MAIREGAIRFYEADTDAEIPPSIHSPSIVYAIDTGEHYLMFRGQKKKIVSDGAAINAGFASATAAMTSLATLDATAIVNT